MWPLSCVARAIKRSAFVAPVGVARARPEPSDAMRGDVLLLFIYICIASLCIAYLRYACDCTRVKDTPHRHRLRHGKSKPSAPLRRLDEAWDDTTSWDDTTASWDDYDVGGFDLDDLGSRLALALFVATLACFMICSCVVQCLSPPAPRAPVSYTHLTLPTKA